jgi:hypothetical protein
MGLLWRLFAPRPLKKARRAMHPSWVIEDAIVRSARGGRKRRGKPQPRRPSNRQLAQEARAWAESKAQFQEQAEQARLQTARNIEADLQRLKAEVAAAPRPPTGSSAWRKVRAAWLPGPTEVRVVGVTFYADAIREAEQSVRPGGEMTGLLMPELDNPHDPKAVAVYLEGRKAGHLPARLAQKVQPALLSYAGAHDGQLIAGPAVIGWHEDRPEVVLHLDTGLLDLAPDLFAHVPDLDQALRRMLGKLDRPEPTMAGCHPKARERLAAAEALRAATEADWERPADAWRRVEYAFAQVAGELEAAGDPLVSDAWTGIARSVRYQKGRRDDWMAAAVTALYWNRANTDAWSELVELASAAPHVPTLLELYRRAPAAARPSVLTSLIRTSRGHDRLGNMRPDAGEQLRAGLRALAEADSDKASVARLAQDARQHARPG